MALTAMGGDGRALFAPLANAVQVLCADPAGEGASESRTLMADVKVTYP